MNKDELIRKITQANSAYANGVPIMLDTEYDMLWRLLYEIDPEHPLLYFTAKDPRKGANMHVHFQRLFSPQRAFCAEDLKPFLTRFGSTELVLEPKYDGCAVVLSSTADGNRRMVKAGDGVAGEDVSHHLNTGLLTIKGTPPISREFSAELIIPISEWDPAFGANPRNVVAGWLNRTTWPAAAKADVVLHEGGPLYMDYTYSGDVETMTETLLACYASWSKSYPIDGIMIKVKDPARRLAVGNGASTYNWSLAWKPPIQTAETTVLDVEWNVSRFGRIVPTIIYEEVSLCGTRNTRATANNAGWLTERGISPGVKITIGKAGEIIPKILSVQSTHNWVELPHRCPKCNTPLQKEGKDLVCNSLDCLPQKIKALAYLYSDKGMDLKGIGEAVIAELLEDPLGWKILTREPHALLFPHHTGLSRVLQRVWSDKRMDNYIASLAEIKEAKSLAHYIAGRGYPGLAYKTVVKLFHEMLDSKKRPSISGKARNSFDRAIKECLPLLKIKASWGEHIWSNIPPVATLTYCITGTLEMPRTDVIDILAKKGWNFVNQISKNVDLLIMGENAEGTTKHRKAIELGVKIISHAQLTF